MRNFAAIMYGTKRISILTAITATLSMITLWLWEEETLWAYGFFVFAGAFAITSLIVAGYSLKQMYTEPTDEEMAKLVLKEVLKPTVMQRLRWYVIVAIGALMASFLAHQFRFVGLLVTGQMSTSISMLILIILNCVSSIVTIGTSILYLIYLKDAEEVILEAILAKYEKLKKLSGE